MKNKQCNYCASRLVASAAVCGVCLIAVPGMCATEQIEAHNHAHCHGDHPEDGSCHGTISGAAAQSVGAEPQMEQNGVLSFMQRFLHDHEGDENDHDDDEEHDHGHGHEDNDHLRDCGCEAQQEGWVFNCSNTAHLRHEFTVLADPDRRCATSCAGVTGCRAAYHYVQAHHDYCLPSTIPADVANGVHAFEDSCDECFVRRARNESLPTCPEVSCADQTAVDATITMMEQSSCSTACGSDECTASYRKLRAWHDLCPEVGPTEAVEEALHEFEDECVLAECNAESEHDHDDHEEEEEEESGDEHDDHEHEHDHDDDEHDHGDEYNPMVCTSGAAHSATAAGAAAALGLGLGGAALAMAVRRV